VFKAHKVLLELKAHKAPKVLLLMSRVHKDHKVFKAHKVLLEHKVHKELKAT
jgi:hypothetical protein